MPTRVRHALDLLQIELSRHAFLAVVVASSVASLGTWAYAQAIAPQPINPPLTLMGDDIAFRADARRGDMVEGRLMVRIDGKWVEANVDGGLRVRRLQSK